MGVGEDNKNAWYRHWIAQGLASVEAMLATSPETGRYCHGDQPTFADLCLVPQLFNARRFGCDESAFPNIVRIDAACAQLAAFQQAPPDNPPDRDRTSVVTGKRESVSVHIGGRRILK